MCEDKNSYKFDHCINKKCDKFYDCHCSQVLQRW